MKGVKLKGAIKKLASIINAIYDFLERKNIKMFSLFKLTLL